MHCFAKYLIQISSAHLTVSSRLVLTELNEKELSFTVLYSQNRAKKAPLHRTASLLNLFGPINMKSVNFGRGVEWKKQTKPKKKPNNNKNNKTSLHIPVNLTIQGVSNVMDSFCGSVCLGEKLKIFYS